MTGQTCLYRRGVTNYHRAAVPKDIVDAYGKLEEPFSLHTKDRDPMSHLYSQTMSADFSSCKSKQ